MCAEKEVTFLDCLPTDRHSATLRRSYARLSTKKVNRNPRMHRRVIWLSYMPPPALYLTVHVTTSSTAYSFSSDLTKRYSSSPKEFYEDCKFIYETRCLTLRVCDSLTSEQGSIVDILLCERNGNNFSYSRVRAHIREQDKLALAYKCACQ